jgi:non-ribosomal peptide synthase protein (TIGR01720 family)
VEVTLGAAETQALLHEVPPVYHTQINDVLLTALLEAFAPWTGRRCLLLDLEGHGREALFADMDVSRTVGWFTSLFPVWLELAHADDPGAALRRVKETLRAVPHRGLGYGLLRTLGAIEPSPAPQPEVIFNYFGVLAHDAHGPFRFAPEPSGSPHSPNGRRPYLIEINAGITGGVLTIRFTYSSARHARLTIAALAERFAASLRSLIDHCRNAEGGFTPADFPLLNDSPDLELGGYR